MTRRKQIMTTGLQRICETVELERDDITHRVQEIYERLLKSSPALDLGNFTTIHTSDLESLFKLYDERFFENGLRSTLGNDPVSFRFSRRMTRSGGTTSRRKMRSPQGDAAWQEYEIAISVTLLFNTFHDGDRTVVMSGIECHDRLQALQRVFEHELVHLAELLIWGVSSCSRDRFQSIAYRFFNHTHHKHQLITPRERAMTQHGIRTGDRVSFDFEGQRHTGIVNRITKRATVLVEDADGRQYSDGKRYQKFYVPLGHLDPISR
jgi:hypothetical protein